MDVNHDRRASRDTTRYEIVVRGELSERFAPEFEGMSLKAKNGRTALVGEIIDQAHLHGILERIRDFRLELVSVEALPKREEG